MKIGLVKDHKTQYVEADKNSNLMDVLVKAGVILNSDCAGRGTCGKCKVKVLSGKPSSMTTTENKLLSPNEINQGWVLSCQRYIEEDIVVEIPSSEEAVDRKVGLQGVNQEKFSDPNVEKSFLTLKAPDLMDQEPDLERVLNEVSAKRQVHRALLNRLPQILRESSFSATAVLVDNYLIELEPGETTNLKYGFVFDIGTTTIASYLIDLNNGAVISARAETNPQGSFGADVITRISLISENFNTLNRLHRVVMETITDLMKKLLSEHKLQEKNVYATVVVGNTTMSHLFLEADPCNLVKAPFTPCYKGEIVVKGKELGLPMHPEGDIIVLPNIAGYVGSDTMGLC